MATMEVFTLDRDELRKMNRSARRKAQMAVLGQGRTAQKIEKNRKKYNRKVKHKGSTID